MSKQQNNNGNSSSFAIVSLNTSMSYDGSTLNNHSSKEHNSNLITQNNSSDLISIAINENNVSISADSALAAIMLLSTTHIQSHILDIARFNFNSSNGNLRDMGNGPANNLNPVINADSTISQLTVSNLSLLAFSDIRSNTEQAKTQEGDDNQSEETNHAHTDPADAEGNQDSAATQTSQDFNAVLSKYHTTGDPALLTETDDESLDVAQTTITPTFTFSEPSGISSLHITATKVAIPSQSQLNLETLIDTPVNTNHTPTVIAISDTFVNEGAGLNVNLNSYFSDIDTGDHLTFSAILQDGSPLPSWVSMNATTGVLTGSPGHGDIGILHLTIIATDSQGQSISSSLSIGVNAVEHAPTAIPINDTSINEDAALHYNVAGHFTDIDAGDHLTFSLANGAPAWVTIDANTGVITGTPGNGDVGSANITIIATDSHGSTVTDTFQITVNNTNDAPTVTPIADTSVNEDAALNYNVSGQFADVDVGDSLTYSLANVTPAWVTIDANTGVISGTPANGDVGVANITVVATDSHGSTVQDTFQLTVNNTNDAPTVSQIAAFVGEEGQAVNYNVSSFFSDVDAGASLTYTMSGAPSWATIDSQTGVISGMPGYSDSSSANITVTATDSSGAKVSNTFNMQTLDVATGTSGNDTMTGNTTNQAFYTLAGTDIVYGDASGNISNGTMGSDIIHGGDGAGGKAGNNLYGDVGGNLSSSALGGHDTIYGGAAADNIYGDAGGTMADNTVGGNDNIHGGSGADIIYGDAAGNMSGNSQGGNDTIYGDAGNDTIYGDTAGNLAGSAHGGNDTIYGGAGNDTIYGDAGGADNGLGGNDFIDGGAGADTIRAGSGSDTIVYDATDVLIDGGSGMDTLQMNDSGLITFSNINNIETIDMSNGLANTVSITASDVLNIGATNNTIIFHGDSSDIVNLSTGNWELNDAAAPPPAGSQAGDYHTYISHDNGAIVQVEAIVQVIVHDPV